MNWLRRLTELLRSVLKGTSKGVAHFSITIPIQATGYLKPVSKDLFLLLDAIHLPLCRPEYEPVGGITHCNSYVAEVCEIYGCKGLGGFLANEIIEMISQSPNWSEIPIERTQDLANSGTLIIAGYSERPHGHVAIVCPGRAKTSGRWGAIPSISNVGAQVFIGKGLSWGFSTMPNFWAWRSSL